jgi:hypothetical protein
MFLTDLLSIIRSLNTVFTAIGIFHTSYVECLLAKSGWSINVDKIIIAVDNRMATIAVVIIVIIIIIYFVFTNFLFGSQVHFSYIR